MRYGNIESTDDGRHYVNNIRDVEPMPDEDEGSFKKRMAACGSMVIPPEVEEGWEYKEEEDGPVWLTPMQSDEYSFLLSPKDSITQLYRSTYISQNNMLNKGILYEGVDIPVSDLMLGRMVSYLQKELYVIFSSDCRRRLTLDSPEFTRIYNYVIEISEFVHQEVHRLTTLIESMEKKLEEGASIGLLLVDYQNFMVELTNTNALFENKRRLT